MRKLFLYFFLFLIQTVSAQFTEDFSDGDFTTNPSWTGNTTQFIVNAQQQLQLSSPLTVGTNTSYLSAPLVQNTLDSTEWRCFVHLNFSPSSSNYVRIYLVSDSPNLSGPLNGYYIQLGESLSGDAVELFEQDQLSSTSIARGTNGSIATAFSIGIRVTRSAGAEWKLYVDYNGGTNYLFEASGINNTFNNSANFGVFCSYTSSNVANFFFDDFYTGPIVVDSLPPVIAAANVTSDSTLDVKFNEPVEKTIAENELNYTVSNLLGNPSSALRDITDFSLVHLIFPITITPSVVYTLTVNNIFDLSNNQINSNSTATFALPGTAQAGDIIINEILFNPFTGGSDYVELYNNSQKIIDLSQLKIANTDLEDGSLDIISNIILTRKLFYPGEYVCITENPADIKSRYTIMDNDAFIDIVDLPTYNDDEGETVLLDATLQTIDHFHYYDDFQFPLLSDDEGISLERISPDRSAQDSSNWHSAAASAGFATPGYKNSQYSRSTSDGSEFTVDPEIFSPDNDGFEDIINIHYKFDKPGYTATVKIYDSRGRPVIDLVKSELLGTVEGVWSWDGIDKDNRKAAIGIYVIYIDSFAIDGGVKKTKKTCVLTSKL